MNQLKVIILISLFCFGGIFFVLEIDKISKILAKPQFFLSSLFDLLKLNHFRSSSQINNSGYRLPTFSDNREITFLKMGTYTEKQYQEKDTETSYQEFIFNKDLDAQLERDNPTLQKLIGKEKLTNLISTNSTSSLLGMPTTSDEEEIEEKEIKEDKNDKNRGGGGIINNSRQNKCDNYKNKTYSKILISEIQLESDLSTYDEFIELYNHSNEEIELTCWKLEKYASKENLTSTPTLIELIPESKFENVKIKPYSFFLISHPSSSVADISDLTYAKSYSISKNNTLILRKPNGEISDLVGYGDDKEKIYQYEKGPFLIENLTNKTLQRKNYQDSDDNSKDFWFRTPTPKNSSYTELPRDNFIDLTILDIENFQVNLSINDNDYLLHIFFVEPNVDLQGLNLEKVKNNYFYNLIILTSSEINMLDKLQNKNIFSLEDFGTTSTLPLPQFSASSTESIFSITKCPSSSTLYYFGIYLYDNLDRENATLIKIASSTFPEDLCNPENIDISFSLASSSILISEVMIAGEKADDEYIELYNPTDFKADLSGWRLLLLKNNKSYTLLGGRARSNFDNIKINPYSYLLLANASSNLLLQPDIRWSKSNKLTENNKIILFNKDNQIVDSIGWGENSNCLGECLSNPPKNKSLSRKATAYSSEESIKHEEKNYGNAYNSYNNFFDFVLTDPDPQNSVSDSEIPPKEILNFNLKISSSTFIFSWLSPYYLQEGLYYQLMTSFQDKTIGTTTFILLSHQEFTFDICQVFPNLKIPAQTSFILNLKRGELLLSSSTFILTSDFWGCFLQDDNNNKEISLLLFPVDTCKIKNGHFISWFIFPRIYDYFYSFN